MKSLRTVTPEFLSCDESNVILMNETKEIVAYEHRIHGSQIFTELPESALSEASLMTNIKRVTGHYMTMLTEKMYAEYSQGKMLHNELRAQFSW